MPGSGSRRHIVAKDVRHKGYIALVRTVAVTLGLTLVYAYVPMNNPVHDGLPLLGACLVLVFALTVWHVRAVTNSDYPGVRAIEALVTTIPFLLLSFAAAYVMLQNNSAEAFDTPLTRLDAFYFSVTVFATVGFGDITAHSELARGVVTAQMIVDFLFIGIVVRVLVTAVKVGRSGSPSAE